jgi:hypothetical protein
VDGWRLQASRILHAKLKRAGFTYAQLARQMTAMKVADIESSVRIKLSRGSFSFAFVLQVMHALGRTTFDVSIPNPPLKRPRGSSASGTAAKKPAR